MKKLLILSVLAVFSVHAADDSVTRPAELEGFFVGAGICWNHTINKIKANEMYDCTPPGAYDWMGSTIQDKKDDRIGGSLIAGYGKFVHDCVYLGGELSLDITSNNTTNDIYYDRIGGSHYYYAQNCGFIPTIAIRAGEYCPSIDVLPYLRLGIAFVQAKYQARDPNFQQNVRKMHKISPVVGFGVEKNICKHFNIRVEGDYRFQAKKEDKTWTTNSLVWIGVENRVKGFTVRVMGTYKF